MQPDPCPRDPASGEFLRVKQLVKVHLSLSAAAAAAEERERNGAPAPAAGGAGGSAAASASSSSAAASSSSSSSVSAASAYGEAGSGRFVCPACVKTILYQKTYLVKPCGHVLCDKCMAAFVVKDKACYVCSTPVGSKADLVALQQGGSSFSGHSGTQAVAKVYTPAMQA
jgi:hypothetical protein